MKNTFFILHFSLFILAIAGSGCTREETIPYDPPQRQSPWPAFDNIRADIKGLDWQIIATVRFDYTAGGSIDITGNLPAEIPDDLLCKVARDSYDDYTGFWPASQCSDRTAKVAGLGDIIAYKGDERVGRLYITSWDGREPLAKGNACFAYFHYADRPFTLSGNSLAAPDGGSPSYTYDASFKAGWNIYYNRYTGGRTRTTTTRPDDTPLYWQFEAWP